MGSKYLWTRLEDKVTHLVDEFPGVAGVCVAGLASPHRLKVRPNEVFPTASSIKIHILAQLMLRAERGEVDLGKRICVTPQMRAAGSGILADLDGDVELTIGDLATLMIIVSDNTATNICIDLAGMEETNDLIRELGLRSTHLRRKMQDNAAVAEGRENVSTPEEMVAVLERLYNDRPSTKAARMCLDVLRKPKPGPLRKGIPPAVPLANKTGGVENVSCDAGIAYLPRRPYAIAVMTKFGLGAPEVHDRFITDVARAVHETMATLDTTTDFGRGIPSP
ncbi:MAG: serine hydrolase [Chloroflexi bacterium]|nr:serine hydrolase [Chloroflexota bacterium]